MHKERVLTVGQIVCINTMAMKTNIDITSSTLNMTTTIKVTIKTIIHSSMMVPNIKTINSNSKSVIIRMSNIPLSNNNLKCNTASLFRLQKPRKLLL